MQPVNFNLLTFQFHAQLSYSIISVNMDQPLESARVFRNQMKLTAHTVQEILVNPYQLSDRTAKETIMTGT